MGRLLIWLSESKALPSLIAYVFKIELLSKHYDRVDESSDSDNPHKQE